MTDTGPTSPPTAPSTTWRDLLLDQLSFYWDFHLWPRLEGLADDEYLWEPASPAWSVRRGPDGVPRLEHEVPEPEISPVTTIAWRMVHLGRDVFGRRAEFPLAALVTHLSREAMAHGAEICLLRDLYRAQAAPSG